MDAKLLEILVCPVTKGPLTYDKEKQELVSKSARLAYPIRDGIPVMLEDEARRLEPARVRVSAPGECQARRARRRATEGARRSVPRPSPTEQGGRE